MLRLLVSSETTFPLTSSAQSDRLPFHVRYSVTLSVTGRQYTGYTYMYVVGGTGAQAQSCIVATVSNTNIFKPCMPVDLIIFNRNVSTLSRVIFVVITIRCYI